MTLLTFNANNISKKNIHVHEIICACLDGHKNNEQIFDESCWTNLESKKVENYARSKTLAEQEAWKFWNSLNPESRYQLTVLNPTFITGKLFGNFLLNSVLGPVLSTVEHGSATIIGRMMNFSTFLAGVLVDRIY